MLQRDRNDVALTHSMARCRNAMTIHTHMP
jgi:hypothetical protein